MAFNRYVLQYAALVVSVVLQTSHTHLYAQPKCYQALVNAANKDWEHKSYQDALNKFRAALTCEEISATDDRRLREKITNIEEEYRKYLFGKIRKARKRADAYDLMFRAMEIKEKDPNMALSYLQAACELSGEAIGEINKQRMKLLQDPGVIAFSKYFSGFRARCIEFLPGDLFIAGGIDDDGNNYVSGHIEDIDKARVGATKYPTNEIIALASSGNFVVLADVKGNISICDNDKNFKQRDTFNLPGLKCMVLSPDGKTLVAGTATGNVYIVSIKSKKKKSIDVQSVGRPITALVFAPDGKKVYTASGNEILVYSGSKFQEKIRIVNHNEAITAMTITATGDILLFSSLSGYVFQQSLAGLLTMYEPVGKLHQGAINSLDVYQNKNNQTIILSAANAGKGAASTMNGQRMMTFVHEGDVRVLKHTPSLSAIFSASTDGILRLWEIGKQANLNEPVSEILVKNPVFATSLNGEAFVACNANSTKITFSKQDKDPRTFSFQAPVALMAVCPEMAAVADAGNNIYLCETGNSQPVLISSNISKINDLVLSPDCKKLVVADDDQNLLIFNTLTKKLVQSIRLADTITKVAYSPDNSRIMIGKNNQTFNYVDADNLNNMNASFYTRRAYGGKVSYLEFSRDGQYALSLTDNILEIWDARGAPAGDEFSIAEIGGTRVVSANFSKDGKYILVVPYDELNAITILPVNNIYDVNAAVFKVPVNYIVQEAKFIDGDSSILVLTSESILELKNYFLQITGTINRIPLGKKIEIGIASFDDCIKSDVAKDLESAIDMYWTKRANALDSELDSLIYEHIQIYRRFFQIDEPVKEKSYHLVNYASTLMSYAERLFNKPASSPVDYLGYARKSVDVLKSALDLYDEKSKMPSMTVSPDMATIPQKQFYKMKLAGDNNQPPDETLVKLKSIELLLSEYYVSVSYYDIYAEKFDDAIIHADSSLYFERRIGAIDKECRGQAITNRALGYLLKGGIANFDKAKSDYRNYYKRICTDDPRFKDMKTAFQSDLDDLEIHFTRSRKFQTYMQRIEEARRYIRTLR